MDVSEKEFIAIMEMRRVKSLREGNGIVGDIIRRDGCLTATRYCGGHHPQYAVYDGDTMICLCVYKKGALNLMDYILKLKKGETRCSLKTKTHNRKEQDDD